MKRFPAKILLFGEYGLLYGAKALALPFQAYGGELRIEKEMLSSETPEYDSYLEIDRFVSFFEFHDLNKEMNYPIQLPILKEDLQKRLYFESDIPFEYGVGSSGALCAAIFDEYSIYHQEFQKFSRNKDILESLKNDFSVMERYFHGTSSGIDPLVSFLGRPVLFNNGNANIVDFSASIDFSIYLIDTNLKSPTGPLVEGFKKKMEDSDFSELFNETYLSLNDNAIESILSNDYKRLFENLKELVLFQLKHFPAMIPSDFVDLIKQLHEKQIFVKLLGSGGGGYLLAFVPKGKQLEINSPLLKFEILES